MSWRCAIGWHRLIIRFWDGPVAYLTCDCGADRDLDMGRDWPQQGPRAAPPAAGAGAAMTGDDLGVACPHGWVSYGEPFGTICDKCRVGDLEQQLAAAEQRAERAEAIATRALALVCDEHLDCRRSRDRCDWCGEPLPFEREP